MLDGNHSEADEAGRGAETDDAVIHEARQRFVATFSRQCDSVAALIEAVAQLGADGPIDSLRRILRDIADHASGIGFLTLGSRALAIDALIADGLHNEVDARRALELVVALREDFATDLASGGADLLNGQERVFRTAKILVVDDDAETRQGVIEYLMMMGYRAIGLPAADSLVEVVRDERPDLILLDVRLPGIDGFTACRLLKTEPALSHIPVIFVTAQAQIDDRLTAFALGAEEFLSKPVDLREVKLRIQLQLAKRELPDVPTAGNDRRQGKASYAEFVGPARAMLQHSAAALALVRLPRDRRADASAGITGALRRRELVGRYDRSHLVVLMPDTPESAARVWLTRVIEELAARGIHGVYAGVTASASPGMRTLEALLAECDEALAEARTFHETVATRTSRPRVSPPGRGRTVALVDDDPDITRLVDSQLRAAGYLTVIGFDGAQAIAAVERHRPDVLVLDLMLPRMSGFDVLAELRRRGDGTRVIVLSGRGREEDVVRAFEAGAADYMTKPFNVGELLVRINRLVRFGAHD